MDEHRAHWTELLGQSRVGQLVTGRVYSVQSFGFFIDAGVVFPVLLEVVDTRLGRWSDEWPGVGDEVEAVIKRFDNENRQIRVVTDTAAVSQATERVPQLLVAAGSPDWPR